MKKEIEELELVDKDGDMLFTYYGDGYHYTYITINGNTVALSPANAKKLRKFLKAKK